MPQSTSTVGQQQQVGGKFLTFFLDDDEYGFEILKVQEIIGMMSVTPVPRTPPFVKGVINLRGKVILIMDLRRIPSMAMIDDQETLQIFLEEAREHLRGIEKDFLALEAAGSTVDVALVNKVFRAVHSIKGGAGFLGLDAIKDLAHAMENLLNLMRNRALVLTPAIINTLLAAADIFTELVHDPASSEAVDITLHIAALEAVLATLPVLAVTSVYGEGAEKRGVAAGVDEYLMKLDQASGVDDVPIRYHIVPGLVWRIEGEKPWAFGAYEHKKPVADDPCPAVWCVTLLRHQYTARLHHTLTRDTVLAGALRLGKDYQ
jgi:HPt (histidine-containing phosphotransfer) domain-containing protein